MSSHTPDIVAVIMAGGMGTRFWPLSTREHPKQFIRLFDDQSLLQKSRDRLKGMVPDDRVMVLTGSGHTGLVREQLPDIPPENIIGEPERKDTAAAVCLGALVAKRRFGNPVMMVVTADHLIEPVGLFRQTMLSAAEEARSTRALYTCGITPDYPAEGYGYLEVGDTVLDDDGIVHYTLRSFREKPDAATAAEYVESGRYLWNSGMFVWTVEAILDALSKHLPAHVSELSAAVDGLDTPGWESSLGKHFARLERISIDYGVMEKADTVRCVAGTFTWKDIGGWLAMRDFLPRDARGNHVRGAVHTLDAGGNIVWCGDLGETVALVGVNDLVVVRAGNETLVVHRDHLEAVKKSVEGMMGGGNPPVGE